MSMFPIKLLGGNQAIRAFSLRWANLRTGGCEEVGMAPNCCDSLGGPTSISMRLGKLSETGIPAFQGMAG